jgi:hypothetical protein
MRAWWKYTILGFIAAVTLIQLVRPSRINPREDPALTIHARASVDPAVSAILTRSCNDCHSNLTVWPWYTEIAPVSWIIASDVNRGRKALNLSEWGNYSTEKKSDLLAEMCKEASDREMPGTPYTSLHAGTRLTDAEIQSVCAWTKLSTDRARIQ